MFTHLAGRRSRVRSLFVAVQVFLILVSIMAPFPVAAEVPAVDPAASPPASAEPTATATPDPSVEPSVAPSVEPSVAPSVEPSVAPSVEPSVEPTAAPAPDPSIAPPPSADPTPTPTLAPSAVPTSPYVVTFVGGTTAAEQADVLLAAGATTTDTIAVLRIHAVDAGVDAVAALRADARVAFVELDRNRAAEAAPDDTGYANQWSLATIGWDQAYGVVAPAGSAVVAVLDTGVDATHPDLDGNLVGGASFVAGSLWSTDANGHGTAVAGIIAAETNNGSGTAGVAYAGVSVMPVTVLDAAGLGRDSDIIEGVVWAVDHGADVINMSFSNPGFSSALQAAIDYAWANDVVVVAATGNDGSSVVTYPAGDRGVIGVSNTGASDALDPSSNFGESVFLAAPGVGILTSAPGGGSTVISGTSASSAAVAGAAGLLRAVDPLASAGVIVGRLARNADAAGTAAQTGNGRLNLARAAGDTATDAIQPNGAGPVGNGGPLVGPYVAAATRQLNPFTFAGTGGGSVTITVLAGQTVNVPVACGGTGTALLSQTVTSSCSSNITVVAPGGTSPTATFTASPNGTSTFVSWAVTNFEVGHTCTGATNPCSGSLSSNPTVTVNFRANTTTVITADTPDPSALGAAYTVSVSVTRAGSSTTNVAGTVTVSDGLDTCVATLTAAQPTATGTCVMTSTTAGSKTLVATYAGSTSYNGSTSAGVAHTVNKANTTTTITNGVALGTATVVGQSYTVDASVTRANGTVAITGTISISDGSQTCTDTTPSGGTAATVTYSCSLTSTTAGSKTLIATYPGDSNYNTSASGGTAHTVNKAATTTTITSDLPDPSVVGQSVTIAYSVAVTAPGAGTPTGNVTVTDSASAQTCTASVAAGSCTIAFTAAGTHNLTATYASDANFNGSASTPATVHVVDKAATTTTITSDLPDPTIVDEAYTVTYSVAVTAPGAGTPTANVTVSDGTDTCTASVAAGSCQLTSTTSGAKNLVATYAGSLDYLGSTSVGRAHQVNLRPTSTSVDCAPISVLVDQGSLCTATVTDTSVAGSQSDPFGDITFSTDKDGDFSALATCSLASDGLATFTSTCAVTYTPDTRDGGTHTIDAAYSHDATADTHADSASGAAQDFELAVTLRTTSTTLDCTPNPIVVAQTTTCTATVDDTSLAGAASAPLGTISFSESEPGTLSALTCSLAATDADSSACAVTYTPSARGDGTHTINASYGPTDDTHSASSDADGVIVTVAFRTTSTGVDCVPLSVLVDQGSTCTATVTDTSANGTASDPVGTVLLSSDRDGDFSPLSGSCTLAGGLNTTDGISTCAVTYRPDTRDGGTHTIDAAYTADTLVDIHSASSTALGGDFALTVNLRPTSTSVDCAPISVLVDQGSLCTATVTDTSVAGSQSDPFGDITFSTDKDGDFSALATCSLASDGLATFTSTCAVTYTPDTRDGGTHTIDAAYSHDATADTHADSASGAAQDFELAVTLRTTSTTLDCTPNPIVVAQTTTCTATVDDTSLAGAASAPLGTISFSESEPGTLSALTCSLAATDADSSACAVTYTPSARGDGTHTINASYGPTDDTHSASSDADGVIVTVAFRTTSTGVDCVPLSVLVDQGSTCTATVTDTSANGTASDPVGTVLLSSDRDGDFSPLSGSCTLAGGLNTTDGISTCAVTYRPDTRDGGTHTIDAAYTADTLVDIHSASSTALGGDFALTVNLRPTSTSVDCAPISIDAGTGTTCTATVTDASLSGVASDPNGTVAFTSDGSGTFTPLSCTLAGGLNTTDGISTCQATHDVLSNEPVGTHTIDVAYTADATADIHSDSDTSAGGGFELTITTSADLDIDKSGPLTATAGDPAGFDYTISVDNLGPSDNTGGFTVSDTLATGLTFVALGSDSRCTAAIQVVTCTNASGLTAAAAADSFIVHVKLVQTIESGVTLANAASVASNGTLDPSNLNDTSAAVETTVEEDVVLVTTKTFDDLSAVVGSTGHTFDIDVTNNGVSDAEGVNVLDVIDARLIVTGVAGGFTCTGMQSIDCDLAGSLAAGATASITVTFTADVNVAVDVPNLASATSEEVTTPADSNTATIDLVQADTSVALVSDNDPSTYGESVVFTATVIVDAPGAGTPTGSVEFFDGLVSLGSDTVDGSGQASFSTSALTAGIHSITAVYSGDTNLIGSASDALSQDVGQRDLTVSATASDKTYDDNTTAIVSLSTDALAGDDVTTGYSSADFDTRHVGTGKTVTVLGITIGGTDTANYNLLNTSATDLADITPRDLTVSATASDKVYDDNTTAIVSLSTDALAGDDVTTGYSSADFDTRHVGTGKTVTVLGITIGGTDAANYNLLNTSATDLADITARNLIVSAAGIDRMYDGTTNATVTLSDNRVSGDDLTTGYTTANFANKHVGVGKVVTVAGITVTGADAGNYTWNTSVLTSATISQRPITVTAVTSTKTADGNTSSAGVPVVSVNPIASGDTAAFIQTYDTAAAGTGKTLTPSGAVNDGNLGANYLVTLTSVSTGVITAAAADHLDFVQQPTNSFVSAVIGPSVTVQVYDAFDNPTAISGSVTLTLSAGLGSLGGTATQPISPTGLATFDDLYVTDIGAYTLTAASVGLSSVTSNAFDILPNPNGFLADVASTDADFNKIDGFDVLFANSGTLRKLVATNPGTFNYELHLKNETGVTLHKRGRQLPNIIRNGASIADRNGGSAEVIITIPSLPANLGTGITAPGAVGTVGSAPWAQLPQNSAFQAKGSRAVQAHPEDRSRYIDVEIQWLGSLPVGKTCLDAGLPWITGQPTNDAFVKCIKVTGFEIPKKHEALIRLKLEFGIKGTDGWATTAADKFRAGFAFKSQTKVTLDADYPIASLADKIYVGLDVAGLTGAGEKITAVGGFVFDQNGSGIGSANPNGFAGGKVRMFNTAPPSSTRCSTASAVAEYTMDADGFYFIASTTNPVGATLPSGVRYYQAVCDVPGVPLAYLPARFIDHKLATKEFQEENFYVSNPTHLGFSIQPITNRVGRTMYAVQVALLDQWNNVVSDGSTQVTIALDTTQGGTLSGMLTKTMSGGYATFTDLKISGSGVTGTYDLVATDTSPPGSGHPFSATTSVAFTLNN